MLEDITFKEFNSLNQREQGDALWEYGELISHRFENEHTIMLYQINNFYVEVKYNDEANRIAELFPFEDRLTCALSSANQSSGNSRLME